MILRIAVLGMFSPVLEVRIQIFLNLSSRSKNCSMRYLSSSIHSVTMEAVVWKS